MANGNEVQGLLSNPLFNMGIGLLGKGLDRPQSFGQGLLGGMQAGTQLQGAAQENQANRRALQQQARQQKSQEEIRGLLQGEEDPSRQQMMGLLAQASPQQFTHGLLGQMFPKGRSDPSIIRTLQAAGIDPQSEEGQKLIRQSISGGDLAAQIDALKAQQKLFELTQQQEDAQEEREAAEQEEDKVGDMLRTDLSHAEELAQLTQDLEGTFGETGVPLSEVREAAASGWAAVGNLLGYDTSRAKEVTNKMQRFNKLANDFAAKSATRMFEGGSLTNDKLQLIQNSQISPKVAPEANRQVLADNLEILLQAAERGGHEVDRKRYESLIEELRGGGRNRGGSSGGAQTHPAPQGAAPSDNGGFRIKEIR